MNDFQKTLMTSETLTTAQKIDKVAAGINEHYKIIEKLAAKKTNDLNLIVTYTNKLGELKLMLKALYAI